MRNVEENKNLHCPNCGAPVTTEVCPYCHATTGLNTWSADMEYPVIECKEAHISFFTVIFPMIFAVMFGGIGIVAFTAINSSERGILSIFILGGIVAFIIAMKSIIRFIKIRRNGKEIEATVYGYINDNIFLNGLPAQIVKLLIQTDDGPKFILYQLVDVKQPYKVNSKVKLKVYQDNFLIVKDKKYYF